MSAPAANNFLKRGRVCRYSLRYSRGDREKISLKAEENLFGFSYPTSAAISVTLLSVVFKSCAAFCILYSFRYTKTGFPYTALKQSFSIVTPILYFCDNSFKRIFLYRFSVISVLIALIFFIYVPEKQPDEHGGSSR